MKALLSGKVLVFILTLFFCTSCETDLSPTCNINEPTDGFTAVKGDVITVSVNAGNEEGDISEVRLFLNKSVLVSLEFPFYYEINTAKFKPGNYSLEALAVDTEGNQSKDEVDFILHPIGWTDKE